MLHTTRRFLEQLVDEQLVSPCFCLLCRVLRRRPCTSLTACSASSLWERWSCLSGEAPGQSSTYLSTPVTWIGQPGHPWWVRLRMTDLDQICYYNLLILLQPNRSIYYVVCFPCSFHFTCHYAFQTFFSVFSFQYVRIVSIWEILKILRYPPLLMQPPIIYGTVDSSNNLSFFNILCSAVEIVGGYLKPIFYYSEPVKTTIDIFTGVITSHVLTGLR